ncbi:MAG: flippase-like domain-containing protein [Polyangiaceae bacterium]|nr:flippase-like domain-containing protein [Polyangiaceae bacterium]
MRRQHLERALRLALSLALGGLLAWVLTHGGLPMLPAGSAFAAVRPWTVVLYALSLALMHYLRAVRWRHLLRPIAPVPTRRVLATAFIGFAAILFLPLRMGEVVRPLLLGRRGPVRAWQAAGTVAAERVIDALALALVLLFAVELTPHLEPLPDHVGELALPVAAVPATARVAVGVFASVLVAMMIFYATRARSERLVRRVFGVVSPRLGERLAGVVARLAEGIAFLPQRRHLVPFLLETAAYWLVNALGLWLLAWGTGLDVVGPGEACTIMGVLGIGILLPAGPAFVGAFQLAVYLALAMYLPPDEVPARGAAFVFLAYGCQLAQHAVGAAIGYALDRGDARGGAPRPAEAREHGA